MTEAEKQACLRYQKTLAQFSIKLKHDELKRYKDAAAKAGMPFRAFVLKALDNACVNNI